MSSSRKCFENRTFHIYKAGSCVESSDYIHKVKFGVVCNENHKIVAAATNGLSQNQIDRSFGVRYPNYQLKYDSYDISCNLI